MRVWIVKFNTMVAVEGLNIPMTITGSREFPESAKQQAIDYAKTKGGQLIEFGIHRDIEHEGDYPYTPGTNT